MKSSFEGNTPTPTPKHWRRPSLQRTLRIGFAGLFAIVAAFGLSSSAGAEVWVPQPYGFGGLSGDHLGASMAIRLVFDSGPPEIGYLYVGLPNADNGAFIDSGEVQIFRPVTGGWEYAGSVYSPVPQSGAHFGASIAADGPILVVGSPDFNDMGGSGAGAGRVDFYREQGTNPLVFDAESSFVGDGGNLGSKVAVDGIMAAAARINASGGNGCLATYRYESNQYWEHFPFVTIDSARCGSSGAALGSSLAIRQTSASTFMLVAGAPGELQNGNLLAGAAHVYFPNPGMTNNGGLLEVGTLVAPNPAPFDVFGTSVAIDANYVYVGATGRDNGIGRVGSVTIFKPAFLIGYDYLPGVLSGPAGHDWWAMRCVLECRSINKEFIMGCPNSTGTFANEGTARVYRQLDFLGQTVGWTAS